MNTCKECRWNDNCHQVKWVDTNKQDSIMPACRDYERADGQRNTEATCGNCPYGHVVKGTTDYIDCRYDPDCTSGTYDFWTLYRAACRHHPRFWKED